MDRLVIGKGDIDDDEIAIILMLNSKFVLISNWRDADYERTIKVKI